ncbi:hypothetical protein NDU88_004184 [Pleurodeles waltl]|uniref:Uncharacterized protein n=1 Tax=Pleurodeles waltl TaxID=8319 RepID=A0AAV7MFW5_PLEWA|nr:hypothetical protein NDU88_004184 [Pleurodeles waltl]
MRRRCGRDRRQNIGGMKGGRRGPGLLLGILFRWRIGPVSRGVHFLSKVFLHTGEDERARYWPSSDRAADSGITEAPNWLFVGHFFKGRLPRRHTLVCSRGKQEQAARAHPVCCWRCIQPVMHWQMLFCFAYASLL